MEEPGTPDIAAAFARALRDRARGVDEPVAALRESCPVVRGGAFGGFWLVTRHDDVATILRTPAVFSSAGGITIPHYPDAPLRRRSRSCARC